MRARMSPQVRGIEDKTQAIVDKALAFAENAANTAWNAISDAVEKALYPGEHRHKQRNAKYKAAMNALLKEAKAAAAAGDYVSAYAIALAAQGLGSLPPYASWPQITGARTQMSATAGTFAKAYAAKAAPQIQQGAGGFYKGASSIPWGIIAAGIATAALFLSSRKGASS